MPPAPNFNETPEKGLLVNSLRGMNLGEFKKAIGNAHGNKIVSKIEGFPHHSFQAYKQIFRVKARPRSLFAPSNIKEDVSQHLAMPLHMDYSSPTQIVA